MLLRLGFAGVFMYGVYLLVGWGNGYGEVVVGAVGVANPIAGCGALMIFAAAGLAPIATAILLRDLGLPTPVLGVLAIASIFPALKLVIWLFDTLGNHSAPVSEPVVATKVGESSSAQHAVSASSNSMQTSTPQEPSSARDFSEHRCVSSESMSISISTIHEGLAARGWSLGHDGTKWSVSKGKRTHYAYTSQDIRRLWDHYKSDSVVSPTNAKRIETVGSSGVEGTLNPSTVQPDIRGQSQGVSAPQQLRKIYQGVALTVPQYDGGPWFCRIFATDVVLDALEHVAPASSSSGTVGQLTEMLYANQSKLLDFLVDHDAVVTSQAVVPDMQQSVIRARTESHWRNVLTNVPNQA